MPPTYSAVLHRFAAADNGFRYTVFYVIRLNKYLLKINDSPDLFVLLDSW